MKPHVTGLHRYYTGYGFVEINTIIVFFFINRIRLGTD